MFALLWTAIFLAALASWSLACRWLSVSLFALGYGIAFATGALDWRAACPIVLLVLAAYWVLPRHRIGLRWAGHVLFFFVAIALMLHGLPGFHNPRVINHERLSADAVPFSMYLNFDKPLIGFWLLWTVDWVRAWRGVQRTLIAGVGIGWLTTVVMLIFAVSMGITRWEPKEPAHMWLWLADNLLLVTWAEEAFFRGYIQGGISRWLAGRSYCTAVALGTSAVFFALAHMSGGWVWVALAGIAGIGYGLAYRYGGLAAAVIAHFGLNVTHFFLLTYPMLQTAKAM